MTLQKVAEEINNTVNSYVLPLSGCGLRLDDRAVHIAVGLRLATNICESHQCLRECRSTLKGCTYCRVKTDLPGLHPHSLNDLI